jgi:putative peptidoglycan lipid II flippase
LILSTLKMASATFSSRILGLVREQVMAAMFGASGLTDAFTIAYRVPNMLRDLFAEGAFSSAFVPTFTKARLEDPEKAKGFLWSMMLVLVVITGLISSAIIVFAPQVVRLMTNDLFIQDQERLSLCITMVRIMAPFLTFISVAALLMGALNSLKVFFWPAMAPAFFNVVMITSMLVMPGILVANGHHPILSLALGVLIGGLVQMFVQVPLLIKHQFGFPKQWSFKSPYIKSTLNRLGIGTIGIAANQINILITTIIATGTVVGAVSWLTYAFRLFQFPVGVLSVSIAGSNLVHFSDEWKAGRVDQACAILKSSYRMSWLVIIPALVLMAALADQSVHLVFERGAFTEYDTKQASLALKAYLIGLPFYGLFKIFGPTFFSLDRPRIPVFISVFCIGLNIIFCLLMVPHYGFSILALGTSLSMMINCLLQCFFLRRYLSLRLTFFCDSLVLKALLSGVISYGVADQITPFFYIYDHSLVLRALGFMGVCAIGIFCYALLLAIMGEAKSLFAIIKKHR